MSRGGLPADWNERFKSAYDPNINLPKGATFYSTPGHGYLRIDTRLHKANVTDYDYYDGPHHVLLEEDCSAPAWLKDNGII